MKLIQLKNSTKQAVVDDEDYERIKHLIWYEFKSKHGGYAITGTGNNKTLMHRMILNVIDRTIQVDHEDHDKLNNQRYNLRLCTDQQNKRNSNKKVKRNGVATSSKYKGVYWNKDKRKWQVTVKDDNKKTVSLGRFFNEEEAARKYDEWVLINYGKFAKLNFPRG